MIFCEGRAGPNQNNDYRCLIGCIPLLRTTKMNNVDPVAWLTQTLERIANGWPSSEIDALMPWNYAA
ncbi:transposase domain-containing protein (plasmid) [Sinorhizobium medicae]|nr:transposase domain-containing protein [Sinorhizobium medicae]WQP41243.1 transposase domain-containing protein [Sinorhizobium medicae]